MAMIYTVREITFNGQSTGKFRMTANSDEDPNGLILGLCEHEHDTRGEALACPVVAKKLARIFPAMPECPECDKLRKRVAELEKALRFYAGHLYKFDDEPTHIRGGVARQALKGGK